MRDSVLFYRSFREAIKLLPEEERLKAYEMIFDYAFDDKESDENGIASAIFKLVKPQIDANNKRYENGKRPKRNISKTEAKQKQNVSKPEANVNVNVNDNVNDNVNVNVNENVNENVNVCISDSDESPRTRKHRYGEFKKVLLTDEEYAKLVRDFGQDDTKAAVMYLDEYITEKGYSSKSHYLAIRRWVINAVHERQNKAAGSNKTAQELDEFYAMSSAWAEKMERGEYGDI